MITTLFHTIATHCICVSQLQLYISVWLFVLYNCDFIFCNVTKSRNCKFIFHDYDFISHNCNPLSVYHNWNFMFHSVTLFLILNNCDFISHNVTISRNCQFLMITTLFHTITNHCTSLLYFTAWFISYFKQLYF